MSAAVVENALVHLRSHVTRADLPALEPLEAHPIVLAHQSIWVDSKLIPTARTGALEPLLQDGALVATNDAALYDRSGAVVSAEHVHGQRVAAVIKRVRVAVGRGQHGAYTASTVDLRRVIHENYAFSRPAAAADAAERAAGDDASVYMPVVEYDLDGVRRVLPNHLWTMQYMAGAVVLSDAVPAELQTSLDVLFLTAYFYCGRVGFDRRMSEPTTDDVPEGAHNRYMTKELFTAYLHDVGDDVLSSIGAGGARGSTLAGAHASADDVEHGAHNLFFTQEHFDTALAGKSLDDIRSSDDRRPVSSETMADLRLSVGGVPELGFVSRLRPPEQRAGKLYVEREAGEDVLYFGSTPIGGGGGATGGGPAAAGAGGDIERGVRDGDGDGHFSGTFAGDTRGRHEGDVHGTVHGMVTDLSNHPIVRAKVLGNGEGHWVGSVNADMVGKFEGHAKIVTGAIDNAHHVTIGTFDATAYLHIRADAEHVRLSHRDSAHGCVLECLSTGAMHISCAALQTREVACDAVECRGLLTAADVVAQHVDCVGITNNFYGIREVGVLEDVSTLACAATSALRVDAEQVDAQRVSVADCECAELRAHALSVAAFHVDNLAFDASVILDSSRLSFLTLSVANAAVEQLSTADLRVDALAVAGSAAADVVSARAAEVAETLRTGGLSTSAIFLPDGYVLPIAALSVSSLDVDALRATQSDADVARAAQLSTAHAHADALHVRGTLSAAHAAATSAEAQTLLVGEAARVAGDVSVAGTLLCEGTLSVSQVVADEVVGREVGAAHVRAASASLSTAHLALAQVDSLVAADARVTSMHVDGPLRAAADVVAQRLSVAGDARVDGVAHAALVMADDVAAARASVETDVSVGGTLTAVAAAVDACDVDQLQARAVSVSHLGVQGLLCAEALSTSALRVGDVLAVDASGLVCEGVAHVRALHASVAFCATWEGEHCASQTLSVHRAHADAATAAHISAHALHVSEQATAKRLSCSALRCDDVVAPRGTFEILSVNSLLGVSIDFATADMQLSLGALVDERVATAVEFVQTELQLAVQTSAETLLTASVRQIVADELSLAPALGSLHEHLSTAAITSGTLSCARIFTHEIVRPPIDVKPDELRPAVVASAHASPDFAFFRDDARHSGDMLVHGSLYVTDTIFCGTHGGLVLDDVDRVVAARISVGELHAGLLLTGADAGDGASSVLDALLDVGPTDAVCDGSLHVRGNMVVSGLVLTGAANRLALPADERMLEIDGALSVSKAVIASGMDVCARIVQLEAALAQIQQTLANAPLAAT